MSKYYRVEYNTGDDKDNWLSIIVEADSPENAVLAARYETKDEGVDYVCTGTV